MYMNEYITFYGGNTTYGKFTNPATGETWEGNPAASWPTPPRWVHDLLDEEGEEKPRRRILDYDEDEEEDEWW